VHTLFGDFLSNFNHIFDECEKGFVN
jgi:hypothetical protein